MRRDFLQFLFGDPALEEKLHDTAVVENLISLYEEADKTEAALMKANKKPLVDALRELGVTATAEAFPQWCEVRFDNEADYRAACAAIFTPDGMYALAEAGWVPAKSGDEGMSNEPADLKLGFFEISVAGEEASDKEDAPELKNIMRDGRENDTAEQDRKDDLNPVENPDDEMGEKQEGVGKQKDGEKPEGKPKGSSKQESRAKAASMAAQLLEMTSTSGVPPVTDPPLSASTKASQRNRLDKLRRRRRGQA